jgi:hypothetical protein
MFEPQQHGGNIILIGAIEHIQILCTGAIIKIGSQAMEYIHQTLTPSIGGVVLMIGIEDCHKLFYGHE